MKASKKLIGAIVALVAALAISVGSTFAWFTTQNNAKVENISATVTTADSSLEVKLVDSEGKDISGKDWGYSVDLSDLIKDNGVKLTALTYDTSNNYLKEYDRGEESTTKDVTNKYQLTAGKFVDFYLAFRSQSIMEIFLDESTVTAVDNSSRDTIYAWKDLDSTEYGLGAEIKSGNVITASAANVARVGFAVANPTTAPQTEGISEYTYKGIWDPNAGQGIKGGDKNLARDYEEYLAGKEADTSALDTKYTCGYTASLKDAGNPDASSSIATLSAYTASDNYYYAYVHVFIWLEGTDPECINNIFGDTLTVNLNFDSAVKGD